MKIARVFPSKTKATPTDELCFFSTPPMYPPEVDEVHVSVAFKWDIPRAEWLAKNWEHIAPVKVGGPAYGHKSGEFIPGRYLRKGYVFTSRGCPNAGSKEGCWFCDVPYGPIELEIKDGWNILDDNILATSENHFREVIKMLKRQPERAQFTGGLEAKLLKSWHVALLKDLNPIQVFFAYDTPNDFEPLVEATKLCKEHGWLNREIHRCYCLIGFKGDTFEKAEKRLRQIVSLGMYPMAMLYRGPGENLTSDWKRFQRNWTRPACIYMKLKGEIH